MSHRGTDLTRTPEEVQRAYTDAGRLSKPLESIYANRPAQLSFQARTQGNRSFESLSSAFFTHRASGSAFLSDAEWAELAHIKYLWKYPQLLAQIELLRSPWLRKADAPGADIVLVDARALQSHVSNGTSRHAEAIARALGESLPRGSRLALLTDADLPAVPTGIFPDTALAWRPAWLYQVRVYVQLGTLIDPTTTANLDLLRAPWITTISVFLDDIQGMYPTHFIGDQESFWRHQLSVEKLRSSSVVLALSEVSAEEARVLWSSLPAPLASPRIMVTSCVTGLRASPSRTAQSDQSRRAAHSAKSGQTEAADFVVFGNEYPHKNVALPVAALGSVPHESPTALRLSFVSSMPEHVTQALRELAGENEGSALSFPRHLTDENLHHLISRSKGVIIPSLHEGFSLPVLEALECGTPVLLSRIPAHLELLPDGPWFFEPTNVASLTRAMQECLREGTSWVDQQREGLAALYSANKLHQSVTEAISTAFTTGTVTSTARRQIRTPVSPLPDRMRPASPAVPPQSFPLQDSAFMEPMMTAPSQAAPREDVDMQTRMRILRESRNWRVGRRLTAPARILAGFARKFSRR